MTAQEYAFDLSHNVCPSDQIPITRLSIRPPLGNLGHFHVDEGPTRTIYGSFHTATLQRGTPAWTSI
jgi:hypothetical protein